MSVQPVRTIRVVDSHTAGEPTRVIIDGGPDLGIGTLAARRERFRREFDRFRSAVVNEPRGSDPVVGACSARPSDPACAAGVIFFNNVGYLGMCGHGTIGLVATLAYLGRIAPGTIASRRRSASSLRSSLPAARSPSRNVPSYRLRKDVEVDVPGYGTFTATSPGAATGSSS